MCKATEFVTGLISGHDKIIFTYETNLKRIQQIEEELTDLSHEIELGRNKSASEGYKLYLNQRKLWQERREAKNENELLEEVYNYLKANPNFKHNMSKIQGKLHEIVNKQKTRQYTPRCRTDLTIKNQKMSKPNRKFESMVKDFKNDVKDRRKYRYL